MCIVSIYYTYFLLPDSYWLLFVGQIRWYSMERGNRAHIFTKKLCVFDLDLLLRIHKVFPQLKPKNGWFVGRFWNGHIHYRRMPMILDNRIVMLLRVHGFVTVNMGFMIWTLRYDNKYLFKACFWDRLHK